MNVRKTLLSIIVFALIMRLAAMMLLQTWNFAHEREFGYEEGEIAYALANGQGYSWPQTWRPVGPPGAMVKYDHPEPTTWKAPVTPAIMALAFWLFGSYSPQAAVALELFQVLLSVISCYVLFRLGRMLFNERTGLAAALIFALYPASTYFSVQKIEYGTLLTFLGLLIVQQTIVLSRRPTLAGSLVLGTLAGTAALVNPVILAFCPGAVLWFLWTCRSEWRTRLVSATAIVVCCAGVIAPWLIRNYIVFDRFVFIRSNFVREFVISNTPTKQGARGKVVQNQGETNDFFTEKAWSLLKAPSNLLRMTPRRVRIFWSHLGESTGRVRFVVGAAYYSVLCLGLAGLWAARRNPQAHLPMIYLLTMPIPFYLTWSGLGRFRFPIEPILVLFASQAVASLLPRRILQQNRGFEEH